MTEMATNPDNQDRLAAAICEHPELLLKVAEHAVGKPRQSLEVTGGSPSWLWIPPARVDGPIPVRDGTMVLPQGAHIHGCDVDDRNGDIHCHLCHENSAARVDEKLECPRCQRHPEERTDKGYP